MYNWEPNTTTTEGTCSSKNPFFDFHCKMSKTESTCNTQPMCNWEPNTTTTEGTCSGKKKLTILFVILLMSLIVLAREIIDVIGIQ